MTTNNSVNSPLSGTTGTGNFVGSNSPTLVTPTLGVATATSIAFSPSTGGNIGTISANNASAGIVGEFVSSVIASGSAVSLTTNIAADLTSISLTAGDWDVQGNIFFNPSVAMSNMLAWISTTSASTPDSSLYNQISSTTASITGSGIQVPFVRINVSSTTTVYLSGRSVFGAGTCVISGGVFARRVR